MVTKLELEIFERFAALASRVCVFGVDWDPSKKYLTVTKSKWKLLANFLHLSWGLGLALFYIMRVHGIFVSKKIIGFGIGLKATYIFIMVAEVVLFLLCAVFIAFKPQLTQLLNQLIIFNNQSERKRDPTIRERVILSLSYCLFAAVFATCVLQGVIEIVYGQTLGWNLMTIFGYMCLFVVHNWCGFTIFGLFKMYMLIFYASVYDTLPRGEDFSSEEKFLHHEMQRFRTLTLLCNLFNEGYCRTVVPVVKYLLSFIGMICFIAAIHVRQYDDMIVGMDWTFMFIAVYIWSATFLGTTLMSGFWSVSSKFLSELEQWCRRETDDFKRTYLISSMKSIRPLRLTVGGVYYMEKDAKLTFVAFLTSGTANMLLASKK